jgi:predicted neuraminidase
MLSKFDPQETGAWVANSMAASVHAASLIPLSDGNLRAFWFAGSREGAEDVVILSSMLNTKTGNWSEPTVVMDRITAEKGLSRYIAKLGNPVPAWDTDGRLRLFFVTVSIGGWAGSSISSIVSNDEGINWERPNRLITSPFLNLSSLVKSPAIRFADGRLGLPSYHELIGKFGEFLRLDAHRVIDKRRMSSGRASLQPLVFIESTEQATAFFRQARSAGPAQIPSSITHSAGYWWEQASDLMLPNPNSAITGVQLPDGTRLLVLNDLAVGRHRLVLLMATPQETRYSAWRLISVLEDDSNLPMAERREFSYPFLTVTSNGDAHLVYTWDRKKIRHLRLPAEWLKIRRSDLRPS